MPCRLPLAPGLDARPCRQDGGSSVAQAPDDDTRPAALAQECAQPIRSRASTLHATAPVALFTATNAKARPSDASTAASSAWRCPTDAVRRSSRLIMPRPYNSPRARPPAATPAIARRSLRAPFLRRPGAQGVFGFLDGLQHDLPIAQDGRGQFGLARAGHGPSQTPVQQRQGQGQPARRMVLRPGKGLPVRLPVIWISPDRVRRGYSSAIDTRSSAAACSTCCSARRMSGRTRTISAGSGAVGSPRGRAGRRTPAARARSGSLQ